jgi:flagellar protein FliO/FliZ
MQWLNEFPFADNRVLQIGFLAACGIAALIVLAIVYRLAFAHRLRVPGGRTRQPRLGLVDAFSLDGQRQLVLIRRDNIEHLVMIGGPNDVLVESQINRAVTPARESAQASPLLVPTTPVRRTEAAALPVSALPEAPVKVAAKAPVSPPAPAPVAPATAAPAAPTAGPSIPKAPVPAQPSPPAPVQPTAPVPASAPDPAGPVSAGPAPTQASETARPAVATTASETARPVVATTPPRQAEPRPAQARATMPPPIIPANASPNRGAPARATEMASARGPINPPISSPAPSSPVAPAPSRRQEKAEPALANARTEAAVTTPKTEPRAVSAGTVAPLANAALAQARPAPKTPASGPASDWARKAADAPPAGDKANAAPIGKPPKVDDPFADLDTLEAEMARLLGREKSD